MKKEREREREGERERKREGIIREVKREEETDREEWSTVSPH